MKIKVGSFIFLLFISVFVFAQEEEVNVVGYRFLDYSANIPGDLLESKSVVLISVPPVSKNSSERGDWESFAGEAHEYFKKIGVDPVAYFYLEDLFAGIDASRVYADHLKKREIKYVIVLSQVYIKIKNNESLRYVMVITPFSNDERIIANGQPAYKDQDKDLEKIMKKLYGISIRKDFVNSNHLIIDQPEFFGGLPIIDGRRNESYPIDLRVDKLAVPKFETVPLPANRPGGMINNRIAEEVEKYNASVERLNFELDRSFQNYPWKYELVNYNPDEKELWRQGYLYILMKVNSSGRTVKEMLRFQTNNSETEYITLLKKPNGSFTLRTIPVNAPVYKFYIRSLARDEVYIGESWDADETWQEALNHFLFNLTDKLKTK
ncbi:MAG: hypothetical protein KFF73_00320 [Cyclobacteriaceae bacterium]|nr:hypothetical protein [Cyclobacteriaceae bacterium]